MVKDRQPFCARKANIHFICAGKPENSSYFLEFPSKTIFIGLSKSIILVYVIPVHKWVMVKDSHFMPENQKIPSYFSEFSSKPHFFHQMKTPKCLKCMKQSYATLMPKRSLHKWINGKKKTFFARKLNLNHKKGSCAQMGYGQKQPFCAEKLNLNHIKRSCAQMGYG